MKEDSIFDPTYCKEKQILLWQPFILLQSVFTQSTDSLELEECWMLFWGGEVSLLPIFILFRDKWLSRQYCSDKTLRMIQDNPQECNSWRHETALCWTTGLSRSVQSALPGNRSSGSQDFTFQITSYLSLFKITANVRDWTWDVLHPKQMHYH